MIRTIILNGRTINYELEIKDVKNINLRIKPDQSVYLSANSTIPQDVIDELLVSKAAYILKALERYEDIAKYAPKPKQYVDGETCRVLGHEYRLRVIEGNEASVKIDGSFIHLIVRDPENTEEKMRTLNRWLKKTCTETICSVCSSVYPKFQKYGVDFPDIRFRNMVSRWGSCQPKRGVLTFNLLLVEEPLSCIEYVVVHEFVHFLQPNHSRRFYQQLSMFMPDWAERKRMLEKRGISI